MPNKEYKKSDKVCGLCKTPLLRRLSLWGTYWIYHCNKCDGEVPND